MFCCFVVCNSNIVLVCKEPPYRVAESGYGSFNLPVEIHFRNNKEEPRKYRLDYDLFLQLLGKPPVNHIKVEALTFLNPSDDFEAKLLRGGACILPPLLRYFMCNKKMYFLNFTFLNATCRLNTIT